MWSHGSFYWNELMTRDVEQAKRFYSSSIGWTFEAVPMPNGTYWLAKMDDKSVAGIFPLSGPELEKLIEDLRTCAMPYTCPHGRPTLLEMNYRELEKKFGRTQ